MGHDDLPLAVEADVSIVSVDPKLSQLSHHQVGPVRVLNVQVQMLNVQRLNVPLGLQAGSLVEPA